MSISDCRRAIFISRLFDAVTFRHNENKNTNSWRKKITAYDLIKLPFNFFLNILFLIKAQLQDRYKQYDIINYANLITNTIYKIITNLQTLSTNSNNKFTLHYIHSQLDLIKDVVNNIKPNNMYSVFYICLYNFICNYIPDT